MSPGRLDIGSARYTVNANIESVNQHSPLPRSYDTKFVVLSSECRESNSGSRAKSDTRLWGVNFSAPQ